MGQAERRASSTKRGPSTPTAPDSVGSPPRKAMRNSLSHRLSREEMGAEELARGALEGVDMRASEVSRDWAQREWMVVSGGGWTGAMDTTRLSGSSSRHGTPKRGAAIVCERVEALPHRVAVLDLGCRESRLVESSAQRIAGFSRWTPRSVC